MSRFTEAQLEQAIIELLDREDYPHVLGKIFWTPDPSSRTRSGTWVTVKANQYHYPGPAVTVKVSQYHYSSFR